MIPYYGYIITTILLSIIPGYGYIIPKLKKNSSGYYRSCAQSWPGPKRPLVLSGSTVEQGGLQLDLERHGCSCKLGFLYVGALRRKAPTIWGVYNL